MPTPAYLNGTYRPLEGLTVPIMDHGFLFGDGIYELIPAPQRRARCLDDHLTRLRNSLSAVAIPIEQNWEHIVDRLIDESPHDDCFVYLQVTRGVIPEGTPFIKHFPDSPPTVFGMVRALPEIPDATCAITREDQRWGRCFIKSTMLLETIMATQSALDKEAGEAILYRDGYVTEGATSNVFAVVGGLIKTPPLSPGILPGVTRKLSLQLLQEHQVEFQETSLSVEELRQAEEVWLTGSTRGVMPVLAIDGNAVGDGAIGPIVRQLRDWYQEYCLRS